MSHASWILALAACVFPTTAVAAQTDWFVNGVTGHDRPGSGTSPADPWKTITWSLAHIAPPAPPAACTLHIAGAQVYAAGTNGEVFPLVPVPGIRLVGSAPGAGRPVLHVPPQGTALAYDPAASYVPDRDLVEDLVVTGTYIVGVQIVPGRGVRHGPTIRHCTFQQQQGQGGGVGGSDGGRADPRFVECDFTGATAGIQVAVVGAGAFVRPVIDGCTVGGAMLGIGIGIDAGAVGGAVVQRSFVGGYTGITIVSRPGSSGTSVELVASQIGGFEGLYIDAQEPAGGHVAIESCYFAGGGEEGILMQGSFAPGSAYQVTLTDNVVERATHNGLLFQIGGTGGDVTITSRRNLAVRQQLANAFVVRCDEGVRLRYVSDGDRAFENGTGMLVTAGSTASIWIVNGMFCRNDSIGLWLETTSADVTASFLTAADNGDHGIGASPATTRMRLDHCVLAGNRPAQVLLPAGVELTWSCLAGQSWPGTGNIEADPLLIAPFYKLSPGSPCVDAGDPGGVGAPAIDYEGDPRQLPGRAGAPPRLDMGADEFAPEGSVHAFGLAGFGRDGFQPRIASPDATARLGARLRIQLSKAIDRNGQPALVAALFAGDREDSGGPVLHLNGFGASGSFLWQSLRLHFGNATVAPDGSAELGLLLPADPSLAGFTFASQWLVFKPAANAAGVVTTQGLRVSLGR